MTNEELFSVAEIVERLVTRFHKQAADHETKMAEHRASFGARTEADAKLIAGLLTQVQDMRVEMERYRAEMSEARSKYDKAVSLCETEEQTPEQCIVSLNARIDRLQDDARDYYKDREVIRQINLYLRAEIAALQERLRASIARGDLAQMEVAALKSQTPKHPVKVGEWVRRTAPHTDGTPVGAVQQVRSVLPAGTDSSTMVYGMTSGSIWAVDYCEPCDPPHTEPVPKRAHPVAVGGYLRRLTGFNTTPAGEVARVTLVDDDDPSQLEYEVVRPNGQKGRWSAKGCEPCDPPEATHDTEAGKAAAEIAVKTEPEEIKVGDLVEVVSNRGRNTWLADVGSFGTVMSVEEINDSISVHLDAVPGKKNALGGYVSLCDVRKVTT